MCSFRSEDLNSATDTNLKQVNDTNLYLAAGSVATHILSALSSATATEISFYCLFILTSFYELFVRLLVMFFWMDSFTSFLFRNGSNATQHTHTHSHHTICN